VPPASATLARTPFQKHKFATPIVPSQHPPTVKVKSDVHRQQYLQPFEQLFDTIEATRNLKSTLDDQIRRSSTLIKTLQTLTHTMEDMVKNQVHEVQSEKFSQLEHTMEQIEQRINRLEHADYKIDGVLPSPGQEEPMKRSSPKSEDYHTVLTALRDKLDRLERQIDT
jgi:predicted nuclease with TOPRIM domain